MVILGVLKKIWQNTFIRYSLIILFALAAAYTYGRYMQPPKVETVTKTVVKTVTKTVTVAAIDEDTESTITQTKYPDGRIETKTTISKKSKTNTTTTANSNSNTNSTTDTKPVIDTNKWKANLIYSPSKISDYNSYKAFGVGAEYKILGSVYVGTQIMADPRVGVTLGVAF